MRVPIRLLGLFLLGTGFRAFGQIAPAIDNERVTVRDVVLAKDLEGPVTPHELDSVVVFLEGGTIRTTDAAGQSSVATRAFGDAVFVGKGSDSRDLLLSDGSAHEILIELKDFVAPPIVNTSPYPAAFPRPGSEKVFENNRIIVWRYSWTAGVPTPMHFHDKDIVVVYRYDGALKSVTPAGASTVNAYKSGEIRFNKGDRAHYEELTTPRQSAVMTELK